jgi:hypothetical protein
MGLGHWRVLALLLTCAIATRAVAQERNLKRSDLPPAVQKIADEQSTGATVRGYSSEPEGGQLVYEVATTFHGHSRDVSIAADGTILEIEEQVTLDSLPAPVRAGLLQKAGSGKITKVESLTKHGAVVAYEAHVTTGTKRSEIQVGPDGKPLAHKE